MAKSKGVISLFSSFVNDVKIWDNLFEEYHKSSIDGLLRTPNVVGDLVDIIAEQFKDSDYDRKLIRKFALSRTCFRMRAIGRKMAADKAESLRARRKVIELAYSAKPSTQETEASTVKKVLVVVIDTAFHCLIIL